MMLNPYTKETEAAHVGGIVKLLLLLFFFFDSNVWCVAFGVSG